MGSLGDSWCRKAASGAGLDHQFGHVGALGADLPTPLECDCAFQCGWRRFRRPSARVRGEETRAPTRPNESVIKAA